MPTLEFHHTVVERILNRGPLIIDTGMNEISWDYTLNTQSFPTYAGEVLQILSCYIDNVTIQGDVSSYAKMEEIHRYFLAYMQIATQGKFLNTTQQQADNTAYNEDPILLNYPERGWKLNIKPIDLPGLLYGADVVVPQWQLNAVIVENLAQESAIHDWTLAQIAAKTPIDGTTAIALQGTIGYNPNDPFIDPFADPILKQNPAKQVTPAQLEQRMQQQGKAIGDYFQNILTAYQQGDFNWLIPEVAGSKPASQPKKNASSTNTQAGKSPGNNKGSTLAGTGAHPQGPHVQGGARS